MTEWKPDHQFLDFLLEEWQKGGGFLVGFDSDEEHTPKTMVEEMRRGTELGQEVYTTAYDYYKADFEAYKANKQ